MYDWFNDPDFLAESRNWHAEQRMLASEYDIEDYSDWRWES